MGLAPIPSRDDTVVRIFPCTPVDFRQLWDSLIWSGDVAHERLLLQKVRCDDVYVVLDRSVVVDFHSLQQMTWLTLVDKDVVSVDAEVYIKSQPVCYEQVADVIEAVRAGGVPVRARIDVSRLWISRVNILGVVDIIWDLHEETRGEKLIRTIEFVGASTRIRCIWRAIQHILPSFIASITTVL